MARPKYGTYGGVTTRSPAQLYPRSPHAVYLRFLRLCYQLDIAQGWAEVCRRRIAERRGQIQAIQAPPRSQSRRLRQLPAWDPVRTLYETISERE